MEGAGRSKGRRNWSGCLVEDQNLFKKKIEDRKKYIGMNSINLLLNDLYFHLYENAKLCRREELSFILTRSALYSCQK